MEKTKIKCSFCEHEWETKSKMIRVTCPSCGKKTKFMEAKKHDKKNI